MTDNLITVDELKAILHYEPLTGIFTWLRKTSKKVVVGTRAGSFAGHYRRIVIGRQKYYEHQLAVLYVLGHWPKQVDHIDGDKLNNRFANLRECNSSQNLFNSKMRDDNTSGFRGVCYDKANDKWVAQICISQQRIKIGRFNTKEEAHRAYMLRAQQAVGDFARG